MKVEINEPPEAFKPITITIETQEELEAMKTTPYIFFNLLIQKIKGLQQ